MPVIVKLDFTDGTSETVRIPAEIWRRNAERVTWQYVTAKTLRRAELDPLWETADANRGNNLVEGGFLPLTLEVSLPEAPGKGDRIRDDDLKVLPGGGLQTYPATPDADNDVLDAAADPPPPANAPAAPRRTGSGDARALSFVRVTGAFAMINTRLAVLVGAMLVVTPAAAHRGHSSLSVVEIDAETGSVTVEHRMAAHDVESALVDIAPAAQPNLDDPEAMAALVAYTSRAFTVWEPSGEPVMLTFAEVELAGDYVRLRYTGQIAANTKRVFVDSNLLETSYSDQENQVNIRREGVTRTALFRPGDGVQEIAFSDI